jgi:hypothetical protein
MVEPPQPIDPNLAQAFSDALGQLRDWNGGGDEPKVLYRFREYPISTICGFVIEYNDPVPPSIQNFLISMRIEPPLELPGFTYAAAARDFLKEIDTRKARYQRSEKF